ncbi:TPA: helix-turn-helix domain-containing protein [Klebsiella pneumoniae]|uniref:helix-turn-helix domain-containing protein n=1 Tax=Enterobacteriaceae TaxID=543 RepID=UPI001FD6BD01|nr:MULTISPECIES: helix-turn-helix domain-containing protein [Enterobacteriaceae]EID2747863.1 MarR family transcriptional regulator [Escherichia coli]HCL5535282.1 MarR family transcriptional regulator [Citrobacter werkmanii]EKU5884065.1 MarR family transcriptional regulator [Klebsiella pneumoniae]EKV7209393.1 MarR family transcriptional regulator [Klebsiella pneumoniae]MDM2940623.1 MarR family transcriptional regulator [Citrobacter sp. Cy082]
MSITSVVLTKEQKSIIAEALEVMPEDLEEIKIKATSYKKTSFRDDFSMIFKGNMATLARMDLTPTAFRIVLYLFSAIDYGNIIPDFSQSRTARELGLNKSNVSRAFKELFERKILIRNDEDGQVYLNSNLCVKGIPHRFNEDLIDKFSKSRLETKDFTTSFNFFRVGRKARLSKP